jgi:vacuolar iron transporter family protein
MARSCDRVVYKMPKTPKFKRHVSRQTLLREHEPAAIARRLQRPPRAQYVSDAVLGGIDGCVTTFAIISGSVGAGFGGTVALILGLANLVADGFSMAVSNYQSVKAQDEFVKQARATEEMHIREIPEGEREEVRQIFEKKGFSDDVLEKIVETITQDKKLWVETMLSEELGLQKAGRQPWRAALVTFFAFVLVGAVPLAPFLPSFLSLNVQFGVSIVLAAIMFFAIGLLKGAIIGRPIVSSGIGTLFSGGTAAGLAFIIGYAMRATVGAT